MTVDQFLQTLIERCLPEYANNITCGNGKGLMEFLQSESVTKPSAFISFEGWNQYNAYADGTYVKDEENYSIFLRSDGSIKAEAKRLKAGLLELGSQFENEEEITKYVQFGNGKAYRDFGTDAFEILITIK